MQRALWVSLVLMHVVGCPGFSDDFTDGDFVDLFDDVVVAERTLKLQLDDNNPTQRFAVPVDVAPWGGSGTFTVVVDEATNVLLADLSEEGFSQPDTGNWVVIEPGLALQISLFDGNDSYVLGVGLAGGGPEAVTLRLIASAAPDVDFDGTADGVVGAIGDPVPVR